MSVLKSFMTEIATGNNLALCKIIEILIKEGQFLIIILRALFFSRPHGLRVPR